MNLKKLTFILFLSIFILLNLSLVITTSKEKNLSQYFRIHVVANSDDIDDQILKLNVAKNIDTYIQKITENINNKYEYIEVITNNIYDILKVAKDCITNSNNNYDVTACIGKIKYDEKTKDGYTMPQGTYESLKIVIGEGNGENWWSLLFPHSIEGYSSEEIISNDNIEYTSGIVNLLNNLLDIFNI